MNYINIGFLAISGLCLLLGFILGLKRGIGKSIIRLIVVAAVIVVVFLFKDKIGDFVLNFKIGSQTVQEFITSKIPEDFQSMEDTIIPIVKLIIIVVAFILGVLILQLVSLIVSAILGAIFAREAKSRLIGGIVGLLQGAIIAVALCVPLAGVCANVGKLSEVEVNNNKLVTLPANLDCNEAVASGAGKVYYEKGSFLFVKIATTKTEDGKTLTLDGQIDALVGAAKMANELMALKDIDFSGGLNSTNVESIKEVLSNLDTINGELTEESQETINNLITELADTFDVPVDLSDLDLSEINFEQEAGLLDTLVDYQEDGTIDDVNAMVTSLANSSIALAALESTDAIIEVTAEQQAEVEAALSNVDDPEKVAAIKALFGIE